MREPFSFSNDSSSKCNWVTRLRCLSINWSLLCYLLKSLNYKINLIRLIIFRGNQGTGKEEKNWKTLRCSLILWGKKLINVSTGSVGNKCKVMLLLPTNWKDTIYAGWGVSTACVMCELCGISISKWHWYHNCMITKCRAWLVWYAVLKCIVNVITYRE